MGDERQEAVELVPQLGEGVVRVTWEPVDEAIPEELEYLATAENIPLARTNAQAAKRSIDFSYLFTKEGKWYGIVCHKSIWGTYKRSRGWGDAEVNAFEDRVKALQDTAGV